MQIFDCKNFHFVGIGGIGVSAIARMLFLQGKKITGSDSGKSEITDDLEKMGIKIFYGQKAENIEQDTEAVIYSIAIKEDNPEMIETRKRNLHCFSYPQFLGELSKKMFTVAVSGTHGKTTTTAMIGHIMKKAEMNPTIIVGSKILGENTNFVAGKSNFLVVEACEYKRSFLNLSPSILVITNIEADHLDYYKNLDDIKNAFGEIANKVSPSGFIIAKLDEKNVKEALNGVAAKILDYNSVLVNREIGICGKHNILDAQAAIKVAGVLGIDENTALKYLEDFKGTWRRLEYKGEKDGNVFYDDYAHHPSEIKASLSALKEKYPDREIVCVFEPHQQNRTKMFFGDFVEALKLADRVFIAKIFITREIDDCKTTNKTLAEAVNKFAPAFAVENPDELKNLLDKINSPKSLCIVFMGAGNIYNWTKEFVS